MYVPKKVWWTTGIVVPIAVALIAAYAELGGKSAGNGGTDGVFFVPVGEGNTLNQAGRDINTGDTTNYGGDVAYTTLQVMADEDPLAPEVVALVERAMDALELRKVDRAVPLLETAAELAPRAAILNNLGAAYLAAGEEQRASEVLAEAKATEAPADVAAAVRHNLRQAGKVPKAGTLGPIHPTDIPGTVAEATRFDDRGGLATLEVTYRNGSDQSPTVCIEPRHNYLIDEAAGTTWEATHAGGGNCRTLPPGERIITWAKFRIEDGERPERFTAVAHKVPRPFENLTLGENYASR